jgi:hypothetical protein
MDIERLGDDDHSYSFGWEDGKQYWFEVVHDSSKDPHGLCRQIRMANPAGRVESFVVPGQTDVEEVRNLWKKMIDCPDDVTLQMNHHNGLEFYWGLSNASCSIGELYISLSIQPNERPDFQWFRRFQGRSNERASGH